jgi:SAM-dependent methyltransferase
MASSFWEQPEVVQSFAARGPDVRLAQLLARDGAAGYRRALDIGCAGGRNTVYLAQCGIEVHAVDAAHAMIAETRRRLSGIMGAAAAAERVRLGRMDDLGRHPDTHFDLVLALGIWHSAADWSEWRRAVAEAVRVLVPGGRLLLSHFTPATDLTGAGICPVAGEPHTYEGYDSGRAVLLELAEIEPELRGFGLKPVRPLEVLATEKDGGRRVSVTGELERLL